MGRQTNRRQAGEAQRALEKVTCGSGTRFILSERTQALSQAVLLYIIL